RVGVRLDGLHRRPARLRKDLDKPAARLLDPENQLGERRVRRENLDLVATVTRPDLEVLAEASAPVNVHLEYRRIRGTDRPAEQFEPDGYAGKRPLQLSALQGGALRV